MSETVAAEVFRVARESIDVLPAPFDAVVAEARSQRRRRRRTVLVSVVAGVLVVAGVAWAASRPAERAPESRWTVTREPNPADVAWYAGGRLHLARVAIDTPPVADLATVADGAAFTTRAGTVYFAGADGTVTEIGSAGPGGRIEASDQTDWVAWVDPSDGVPRLVLHNLVSGKDFATLDLPDGGTVIAVDQAHVYYATPAGEFRWGPDEDAVRLDRTGLLDAKAGVLVYATDDGIEMTQAVYNSSVVRPGVGARISPTGGVVLSAAGSADPPFRPLLYAVRSGDPKRSGLTGGELALDATFGPNHTVSYLIVPRADLAAGPDLDGNPDPLVVLRTCDLDPVVCHDVLPLARPGERPVLAH
ncbi:hypothetical protein [Nocardioides sp.]|uniref:hypothetical protein n=1 Tax=Nocardioides sp. TaxID=35761 RepID=UPI002ED8F9C0